MPSAGSTPRSLSPLSHSQRADASWGAAVSRRAAVAMSEGGNCIFVEVERMYTVVLESLDER